MGPVGKTPESADILRVPQGFLLDSIRDSICIVDVRTMRIVAANRTFYKALGYKKGDVIGRHCYEVTHHHNRACSGPDDPCPLIRTLRTGSSEVFEHVHCHKGGRKVYMEVSASPIRDPRGKIAFVIHVARDITERKTNETEFRKLKTAVESSGEAIFLTDRDGVFTFVNPEFTRLYGYSPSDVVGKRTPRILKSGKMKRENYVKFWKRIVERKIIKGEVINKTRDGKLLEIESTVSPVLDGQNKISGFLAIQRDITLRKQDEKRLNYLAYHDILTDLPNRLLFNDHFNQSLARAARYKTILAVMLMDLDRFKEVNDSHGHRIGDQLLKSVAQRLQLKIRGTDTIARLWGDEFGVLVGDMKSKAETGKIARKILGAVIAPYVIEGYELNITASIGVCLYPEHGNNIEDLLKNADRAMYRAKEKGRNSYEIYSLE
jgi:diguanylate cyclase (GGDEF)-like protein/PAS domain S-box-containing protein